MTNLEEAINWLWGDVREWCNLSCEECIEATGSPCNSYKALNLIISELNKKD